MAQYYSVSQNVGRLRVCPINPAHVLEEKRFCQHLIKCKKSNPGVVIYECPFNSRHLFVKQHEYEHHKMNCPDAAYAERPLYLIDTAPVALAKKEEENEEPQPVITTNENWDEESKGATGYNPIHKPIPKGTFVNGSYLSHMRPAEKRAFHANSFGGNKGENASSAIPIGHKPKVSGKQPSLDSTKASPVAPAPPKAPPNVKAPISSLLPRAPVSNGSSGASSPQQRQDDDEKAQPKNQQQLQRSRGRGSRRPPPGLGDV